MSVADSNGLAAVTGETEERLGGGNMETVVRVGDTVRRVTGEWTPAIHELLRLLEAAGIDEVPRALGIDERGREVLAFLPGEVLSAAPPGVQWSDGVLAAAARLLRRIHDASAPLAGRADLVWRSPSRAPAEVICHNDFAPYNLIVRGESLAGAIDFDFAAPGTRLWDLAYLAYRIVPFADDAREAAETQDADRRLALLIESYGSSFSPDDVQAVAADRLDALAAFTRDRARVTGRTDFLAHAAMYERDASHLRSRVRAESTEQQRDGDEHRETADGGEEHGVA